MSAWTHNICSSCWNRKNPGRVPILTNQPEMVFCCYCENFTFDGIYVRDNPANVPSCTHMKKETSND